MSKFMKEKDYLRNIKNSKNFREYQQNIKDIEDYYTWLAEGERRLLYHFRKIIKFSDI